MKRLFPAVLMAALLLLCACGSSFEPVLPNVREFPAAEEYLTQEVVRGTYTVRQTFRGYYRNGTLYAQLSQKDSTHFALGDQGFVTYEKNGRTITVPGTLTTYPESGSGVYIVTHERVDGITYDSPGEFYTIEREEPNALLVPAKAVTVLNGEGLARINRLTPQGSLEEIIAMVEGPNDGYYHALSGINDGEKVVVGP